MCVCVCVFLQQLIFAKTTERAENCKMKEKKSATAATQSSSPSTSIGKSQAENTKNWSRKLKNPQKLGLKYAKRVESMWKNETQQQQQQSRFIN